MNNEHVVHIRDTAYRLKTFQRIIRQLRIKGWIDRERTDMAHHQRVTVPKLNQEKMRGIPIALPPLATQQAIVAEIEAEQALVAANRELIERFEKKIQSTLARIWGEETTVAAV